MPEIARFYGIVVKMFFKPKEWIVTSRGTDNQLGWYRESANCGTTSKLFWYR